MLLPLQRFRVTEQSVLELLFPRRVDIKSPNPYYGFCPIKRSKVQSIRMEPSTSTKKKKEPKGCSVLPETHPTTRLQQHICSLLGVMPKFQMGLLWSLMWRFKGSRLLSRADWSTDWLQTSWISPSSVMKEVILGHLFFFFSFVATFYSGWMMLFSDRVSLDCCIWMASILIGIQALAVRSF